MPVTDWNTNAALNVTVDGIDIAEGCAPANLNNAMRSVMANVRVFYNSSLIVAGGDGGTVTIQADGGALPATPAENDILIEYTP